MTHCNNEKKESEQEKQPPYSFYEHTITNRISTFYISEEIKEPEKYTDMIHRINTAQPGDSIVIHLNTPGGHFSTGVQIINAIQGTPAHVVTVLSSRAHSMGTFIFLAGHEYVLSDNCLMMFHNFSSGTYGKGNEQTSQLEAAVRSFNKLMKKYCSPFLSNNEIERIIKGEDIWMDSDEIRKRLTKLSSKKKLKKKS